MLTVELELNQSGDAKKMCPANQGGYYMKLKQKITNIST